MPTHQRHDVDALPLSLLCCHYARTVCHRFEGGQMISRRISPIFPCHFLIHYKCEENLNATTER